MLDFKIDSAEIILKYQIML